MHRSVKASGLIAALVGMATGCGGSPAAPGLPAVVGLTLSAPALDLTRNSSATLTLSEALSDGTSRAVSGAVTWGSSDPAVAVAEAGVVRAIGLGTARVFAVHQGRTATAEVAVRRNMRVEGQVFVGTAGGGHGLEAVEARIDGRRIGSADCGCDYTGFDASYLLPLGRSPGHRDNAAVAPGSRELALVVYAMNGQEPLVTGEDLSYLEVIDVDTGERLARLPLARQQASVVSRQAAFSWTIVIEDFR